MSEVGGGCSGGVSAGCPDGHGIVPDGWSGGCRAPSEDAGLTVTSRPMSPALGRSPVVLCPPNGSRCRPLDPKQSKPSTKELLADWRMAERIGDTARSAAEAAGLAVESADAAKAAAASAQAAVTGAAEAVDRAKEASDLASAAASQASDAAQQVYADAQEDVERTGEIAREANALVTEAGDAYREAQSQAFERHREQ